VQVTNFPMPSTAKPDAPRPRTSSGDVEKKVEALFANGGIAQLLVPNGNEALMASLGEITGNRTAGREKGLVARGSVGVGERGTSTVGIGRTGTVIGDRNYGAAECPLCAAKEDREVTIAAKDPVVVGALDKDIIRRIVKEHEAHVRYCYEKSLQTRPGLEGKVTVRWVIAANGHVQVASADESTLHDVDAERCLTQKVRTWVFPAPRGGGVVVVNYPFVFKAS
jgi:hypothetical protein